MAEYVLLGAAALHPSMRHLSEPVRVTPPGASPGRLAVLAVASLIAPTVLVTQHLRARPAHVVVTGICCAVLFLLVLARMAGLVAAQRQVAITDSLTGLYTRGFFQETLRVEAARAARGQTSLGILLMDADHFKRVNDNYGHPAGDSVLTELARRVRGACRPGDVVARYGGEEFAVLLAGAGPVLALEIAERVRRTVADSPLALGEGFHLDVTVSVGVAVLPGANLPPVVDPGPVSAGDAVVGAADRALYAAKHAGRNRIAAAWHLPAAIPA
jgi:diguanylate cyclase (GGDEF)-like protein